MTTDPFFLVYRRRSGSTFLSNLLCGSPEIGIAPESRFLERLWKRFKERPIRHEEDLRQVLDAILFAEPRFSAWEIDREEAWKRLAPRLPLLVPELSRWLIGTFCDHRFPGTTIRGMKKGGWYARNIDVLRTLFPTARFIMLLRDGRAVFSSCKRAHYGTSGRPFETNPRREAFAWHRVVRSFERHRSSDFTLLVRYEDLIAEPRSTLRSILEFLGASATDHLLDSMLRSRRRFRFDPATAHLHRNVDVGPLRSRIDAWRQELSPVEIRSFELAAGPALERNGYPLLHTQGTQHRLQRSLATIEDMLWRGKRRLSGAVRRSPLTE